MKILFRNIHLYLGLAAGLFITIACVTGAILVFEKELQQAFNHHRYFVKKQLIKQPVEKLITTVKQQAPGARITGVKIYADDSRSVEISFSKSQKSEAKNAAAIETSARALLKNNDKKPSTQTEEKVRNKKVAEQPKAGGKASHTAFVNPYTAEVIEIYNYRETGFYTVFALHRWLLGGDGSAGKYIMGISTLIFLFILLTGIVLWFPKTKKILIQRLKIRTNASWKRINRDLHIVFGFYSFIFLFVFAFTALAWSFQWFNKGIYTLTGTEMKAAETPHSLLSKSKTINYDDALAIAKTNISNAVHFSLKAPADSLGVYTITALPKGAHESAIDNYYVDQYTGKIVGSLRFNERNIGQRIRATFKPVHTGSIYGLPSKIVAFISCLLGASFPITGVIMWLNRLRKQRKKSTSILRYPLPVSTNENEQDAINSTGRQ